jgi:hypothetical protein
LILLLGLSLDILLLLLSVGHSFGISIGFVIKLWTFPLVLFGGVILDIPSVLWLDLTLDLDIFVILPLELFWGHSVCISVGSVIKFGQWTFRCY